MRTEIVDNIVGTTLYRNGKLVPKREGVTYVVKPRTCPPHTNLESDPVGQVTICHDCGRYWDW